MGIEPEKQGGVVRAGEIAWPIVKWTIFGIAVVFCFLLWVFYVHDHLVTVFPRKQLRSDPSWLL